MTKIKTLLFLFVALTYSLAKADSGPKLHPKLEIQFSENDQILTDFDSIYIMIYMLDGNRDTMFLSEPGKYNERYIEDFRWHSNGNGSNYVLEFFNPIEHFQIFLIHQGTEYKSDFIDFVGARSFHEFELDPSGKIKDSHNLFYSHWSYYLISLIVTLILEFLIALILYRTMRGQFVKFLIVILIINFITHPILWYIDSRFELSLSVLELVVIIIEIIALKLYYRAALKTGDGIFFGILANLTSWWIGGIIAFILYEIIG